MLEYQQILRESVLLILLQFVGICLLNPMNNFFSGESEELNKDHPRGNSASRANVNEHWAV